MNREFKEFVTYKALAHKHGFSSAIDLDEAIGQESTIEIKNVCTKMTKELSDRIDNTVNFLDIRKRKFIEMAVTQALEDAEELMDEHLFSDEEWIKANGSIKNEASK